jgi:hypothetical protein
MALDDRVSWRVNFDVAPVVRSSASPSDSAMPVARRCADAVDVSPAPRDIG